MRLDQLKDALHVIKTIDYIKEILNEKELRIRTGAGGVTFDRNLIVVPYPKEGDETKAGMISAEIEFIVEVDTALNRYIDKLESLLKNLGVE